MGIAVGTHRSAPPLPGTSAETGSVASALSIAMGIIRSQRAQPLSALMPAEYGQHQLNRMSSLSQCENTNAGAKQALEDF